MNTQSLPTTKVRHADSRGRAEHGWLHARFTFSFGDFHDSKHMGFRALRVMNNDTIEPGGGFPPHPHRDMEIFTYVIDGELAHTDSMGNGSTIKAGDLQYMSAGDGVRHSEFNPSRDKQTHLYQVWLTPDAPGGEPRYAEKPLAKDAVKNQLAPLFSPDGRDGSTAIRASAEIHFGKAEPGVALVVPEAKATPHAWLQVIDGELTALHETLKTGDGLAIEDAPEGFEITAVAASTFLLFRLA